MHLSNLINRTLIHVRAKVMNLGAPQQPWNTREPFDAGVAEFVEDLGLRAWGLRDGVLDAGQGVGGGGASG
jgi:hypothetical protein